MLPLYIIIGMIVFALVIYMYGQAVENRGHKAAYKTKKTENRDMWMNSLLECYYEPAKYVFGPGKAIPAKRSMNKKIER